MATGESEESNSAERTTVMEKSHPPKQAIAWSPMTDLFLVSMRSESRRRTVAIARW